MSGRLKWLLIAVVSLIAVGSTTAMGVFAWARYSSAQSAPAGARSAASADWARGDRIVFRNTAGGQGYGPGDKRPGDAKGQGILHVWYVLSPRGTPIK